MDEMALLERMRSEVEPDSVVLIRTRRRVLRRAVGPAARRRLALRVAAVAGGVGIIAAAVGVLQPGSGGAEPAAAAVLDKAVDVLEDASAPAPGEYLHVRMVTTRWQAGRTERTVQESWVPGDPRKPRIFRDFDGNLYRDSAKTPAIYTDPSVDVEGLLEWLRRDNGDLRGDDAAYERAGEVLSDSRTPLAFKARLFAAIERIDGVKIIDGSTDFYGQHATILGRDGEPLEAQFAFDRRTGAYLGMQAPSAPGSGDLLSYSTRTSTKVVRHLPARARQETWPSHDD